LRTWRKRTQIIDISGSKPFNDDMAGILHFMNDSAPTDAMTVTFSLFDAFATPFAAQL